MLRCCAALVLAAGVTASAEVVARMTPAEPYVNLGTTDAVGELLDRVLPGSRAHFTLELAQTCPGAEAPCYALSDDGDQLKVTATGAAELAAGIGFYLREHCNMVIGWPRGGGSNVFIPSVWPKIGSAPVLGKRNTPWSYMMNVCTHSYSLVWYSWKDWENFIDWMALSGINLFLGMTGQEEIQFRVFQKFGLNDTEIRSWFNGPALLTWSRGQNEYGHNIGGPLPRSWMKQQWNMMKDIAKRYRSLGMSAQLPAFQVSAHSTSGSGWLPSRTLLLTAHCRTRATCQCK
jgi:alpha-N-acetylglucosaminidase